MLHITVLEELVKVAHYGARGRDWTIYILECQREWTMLQITVPERVDNVTHYGA